MANFCPSCGAGLTNGMRFCSFCGLPIMYGNPNQAMQQSNMQQMSYQQRPQGQMPPQMQIPPQAQMPPQMQGQIPLQMQQPPRPKKKSKVTVIPLIILMSIFFVEIIISGLLVTGLVIRSNKNKKDKEPPQYHVMESKEADFEEQSNTEALLDYARKLEEQGNIEAANAIYNMLPDSYLNDAYIEANEMMEDAEKQIKDENLIDAEEKTEFLSDVIKHIR